ncbi:MAG TPA: hypothetical protein PKW76_16915 [bacterium]|nr:hypothetical protein [bacterium]HPG47352.1 hypothetical protein [bacterium]HPM96704.1 hypothetical protein [bacterium]
MRIGDDASFHPQEKRKVKNRNWKRLNFGDPTEFGTRKDAENEVDRDMLKTSEQIACDIHETYFRLKRDVFGDIDEKENNELRIFKHSMDLILLALSRTASMNAKIAKSNENLSNKLFWFTVAIFVLTLILVCDVLIK